VVPGVVTGAGAEIEVTCPDDHRHHAVMTSRSTPHSRPAVPAASGVRAPWSAVPDHLRARVLELLGGGEVVEAVSQAGGFSPGPAVRLRTSAGRRAFVKAVSVEMNPDSPGMHRDEARFSAQLPPQAPVPRLLGSFDEDGWVILVFEEIDGRNPDPHWGQAELRRVVDALAAMSDLLTPSPVEAPSVAGRLATSFTGWRSLVRARADGDDLGWLDPWAAARLDQFAAREEKLPELCTGTTLLNMDVRADNILIAEDRVYFVDWPWASQGAPWLDLALFVPSVWMHTGPEVARIATDHPLLTAADPEALACFAAGVTGMLLHRSHQPAPPGLPTLRHFQGAFGAAGLEWLRTLIE
jgi:hypothetical protein